MYTEIVLIKRNVKKQKNVVRQRRDFIQLCTIKYISWGVGGGSGEWGGGWENEVGNGMGGRGGSNSDMHRGRVVIRWYDHKS